MFSKLIEKIKSISITDFFSKGHERSLKAKKNIVFSVILKGISILISFLMVPLTLHYLNPLNYGIWLTLTSIIGWFYILDIGLGNGLRNKFAEALAKGDKNLAKTYVSTTYALIFIIISIFYILFLLINPFLNWVSILNTPPEFSAELNKLVFIVITFFCFQFVLKLIGTILLADQRPALNDLIGVVSGLLSLITIFILSKTTEGSLIYLGTAFTLIPVIVYFFTSIFLFSEKYRMYIPDYKFIDWKYGKELSTLGIKFFFIQISGIVIYSTSNIIITQVLGPSEVTPYNIAYKYFSIVSMFFMIIMTPFWSGFTEAYHKGDFEWIKRTMRKLNLIAIGTIGLVMIMIIASDFVYKIWIGDVVKIPFILSLLMGLWVMILTWGTPFVFFINGVGKIKLQLYIATIAALLNIPLAIWFSKYLNLGITGIISAICLLSLPTLFLYPLQYKRIINNKMNPFWDK